jgi:hemoglobin-like flavoprotein
MKKILTALSMTSILILVLASGCQMKASRASAVKATPTVLALFAEGQQAAGQQARLAVEAPSSAKSISKSNESDEEEKPTPDLHRPGTYSLNKGEWPFCIARRYNLNPIDLLNASGLSLESKPDVGFVLKIPQSGEWPESRFGHRYIRIHPAMHEVVAGETLNTIACLYGDVDPSEIVEANGLPEPYTISAGKMLRIP